jgi:hypothetical protein
MPTRNPILNEGMVVLTGMVDNLKARMAAEEGAGNTVGVWRVKNHLRVRPDIQPSDPKIASNVQSALLLHPLFSAP